MGNDLEKISNKVDRIIDENNDFKVRLALLDDSIQDMEKHIMLNESHDAKDKQRMTAYIICIITCTAAIIAAILQGLLTGT